MQDSTINVKYEKPVRQFVRWFLIVALAMNVIAQVISLFGVQLSGDVLGTTGMLMCMYGILTAISSNKALKNGSSCIFVGCALPFFISMFLANKPISSPIVPAIIILLSSSLILAGYVQICKDPELNARVSKISSLFIFLTAACIPISVLPGFIGYALSNSYMDFLKQFYIILGLVSILQNVLAIIFWFKLLKEPAPVSDCTDTNPYQQPATYATAAASLIYLLVLIILM